MKFGMYFIAEIGIFFKCPVHVPDDVFASKYKDPSDIH